MAGLTTTFSGTHIHHKEAGDEVASFVANGSHSWAEVKNKFRDLARSGEAVVGDEMQIFKHIHGDDGAIASNKYLGTCRVIRPKVISCAD